MDQDGNGSIRQGDNAPKPRTMTLAEFQDLPRELGWRYELRAGQVHKSLSPYAVATLRLKLSPQAEVGGCQARPLSAEDYPGLARLFLVAFADSVEYHGCPRTFVRQRAEQSMAALAKQSSQPWLSAARLIEAGGKIVAAALVRTCVRGPILEPLMVRPSHQRQGLATAVMAPVVNHLLALGARELCSQCHLANEASIRWHQRFGFEELPDEWVATHRAQYFRYELERRSRNGAMTEVERRELVDLTGRWEAEAERMREMSERDFQAAHPQLM